MKHAVTLVTPTYVKDLERFTFQRESIERCGIEIPHVALVNHEDVALFEKIPFRQNLRVLSSRDILPPRFEARRLAWGSRRRELRYWRGRPALHGWYIQQLMKLAVSAVIETEGMVCLDSDTLFVDKVVPDDFYASDGRMHLFETDNDVDLDMAEWYAHSMRFLGLAPGGRPIKRTTHSPVPWHCQVVREMLAHIEKQHGVFWMEAMARADRIMEYSTYGAYARYIDNFQRTTPVRPNMSLYYWWGADAEWGETIETFERELVERVRTRRPKTVLINSSHDRPVAAYRGLIEQAWAVRSQ